MVGILSISLSSSMMLLMMLESRSIVMSVHVSLIGVHWLFGIGGRTSVISVSVAVGIPWVGGACASAVVVVGDVSSSVSVSLFSTIVLAVASTAVFVLVWWVGSSLNLTLGVTLGFLDPYCVTWV